VAPASPPTNRPTFNVNVTVTKTLDDGTHTDLEQTVQMSMLGPGDAVGIRPSQVIRTEPADGSTGVETELFAAVEFADPTLPWMFTPAAENALHQLQPWICLVVVPVQDGVTMDMASGRLTIAAPSDPRKELPDLSEAWAWAHAQYARADLQSDPATVLSTLAADPSLTMSRLLSSRRLIANTQYIACVVPSYMAGRKAGLGETPKSDDAAGPAWDVGTNGEASVVLPVYFSFTFTTGVAGDFLSLAQLLAHPPDVSTDPATGLGARTLQVPQVTPAASLPMPGMLEPATQSGPLPPAQAAVTTWLRTELTPTGSVPQLRAPLYGGMQAGIRPRDLANFDQRPLWWRSLNCDPRMRVAAALGKRVVANEREFLVAAAWDQVDQAREINVLFSRAQLARSISARLVARHFPSAQGSALNLLQLVSPQASRIQITGLARAGAAAMQTTPIGGSVLSIINDPVADPRLGAVAGAAYRKVARPRGVHALRTRAAPAPDVLIPAATLRAAFDMEAAVPNRVLAERLSPSAADAAAPREDPLRELAPDVAYPFGMFTPLAQIAPEAVLPGASSIPPNTALTLTANRELVAAYMVGLNTEIVRVLLWRGVPSNRRATPFTTFWDKRGQSGPGADIKPIDSWKPGDAMIDEFEAGKAPLILAVRAELLRRYPRTAVFATPAHPIPGSGNHDIVVSDPAQLHQPAFTGLLPPDLRLYGFPDIDATAAIGSPGYFFVLQEQVTEARFGSDPAFGGASPTGNYYSAAALGLAQPNAAMVADKVRMPPVMFAVHARALLPQVK
jgi:hypothetical protein